MHCARDAKDACSKVATVKSEMKCHIPQQHRAQGRITMRETVTQTITVSHGLILFQC